MFRGISPNYQTSRLSLMFAQAASILILTAVALSSLAIAKEDPPKVKISPAVIAGAVDGYFAKIKGFKSEDVITRNQVQEVLAELKKNKWTPRDADKIIEQSLDEGSPLAVESRSAAGRKFMRRVSSTPLVYDRLDRVSRMPGGKQLVHDIIRLPDGHKYVQSKPTPAFKNLAQLLPKGASGKTPKGVDFDKPTGRIYTADMLKERLTKSLKQESQPPKQNRSRKFRRTVR